MTEVPLYQRVQVSCPAPHQHVHLGQIMCDLERNNKNNVFTEMCSGSEAGSYVRRIDFLYQSTLGLRVRGRRRDLVCNNNIVSLITDY